MHTIREYVLRFLSEKALRASAKGLWSSPIMGGFLLVLVISDNLRIFEKRFMMQREPIC
jgi:hypothetical protein